MSFSAQKLKFCTARKIFPTKWATCNLIFLREVFKAKKVFGIEIEKSAIDDARINARQNKIFNAEFIIGDALKIIPELYAKNIFADVVIVDPPRVGCDKKILETFAKMQPKKIIYVSCNPATLARDLSILKELNYFAKKVQPVDMFPFTSHIESVTQIIKN